MDVISTTQEFVINILDENDNAPVFTSANVITIDENTTAVTTLTTTDADTNPTVTYSIAGGADSAIFNLDNSGVLTLAFAPDYEFNEVGYEVIVTANDGVNTTDQTISVTVEDVNDNAPVFTSASAFTIDENTTAVTTLVTTDADTNSTVTYSITGGADASSFALTAGVLTISGTDYESGKTDYEVIVTANDGVNTTDQTISVTVEDVNDNAPVFTSASAFTIDENTTAVTTLATTDADTNSTVTYSITGGADANSFAVTAGVLTISGTDYESGKTDYEVIVTANDGVNTTDQTISVTVTNVNEKPEAQNLIFDIPENKLNIGSIDAIDPDGDNISYVVVNTTNSPGGGDHSINVDSNGIITFTEFQDYEEETPDNQHPIVRTAIVYISDEEFTVPITITVNISDVNESPYLRNYNNGYSKFDFDYNIDENEIKVVDNIYLGDPDSYLNTAWSVSSNDSNFIFELSDFTPYVSDNNKFLSINLKEGLDYESLDWVNGKKSFVLYISDGVNTITQEFSLRINDVNDNAPVFTSASTFTIDENTTAVTTLATTDADTNSTVTYSITGGADANSFALTAGVLTISGTDYESGKTDYEVIVTANDGVNTTDQTISVTVEDVNDNAPVFTSNAAVSINENQTGVIII